MRNWLLVLLLAIGPLAACDDSGSDGYTGGHGVGLLVDDPDDPNNWPLCSDGARHPDCSYAPLGY
ncbi:hypothetical protein JWJ88_15270 [Paracoccus methylovorus]|jgi:hypothetical protein|uniref:Lipoprotein n=2 Tax=Paracoccus TaxID=265 RepID=A0A7H9BUR0_PARPN|nr:MULTISPECIES: hypothetical protein [Paracoccus]MBB4628250.1 hypothetical protein [Paracoccus denitrificans]MCU7429314.1 hypothetical protein [Paracoccus denitrificans]MDK8873302.1 hypothetical protein [Paracoccus sp. SSJ]QAR27796.1 hypothetical protein EO213_15615 [Paracoccus denitrificans]QLH14922.1 hypothetical protein HYQ43_11685 [Paracoccus pantotrophus]